MLEKLRSRRIFKHSLAAAKLVKISKIFIAAVQTIFRTAFRGFHEADNPTNVRFLKIKILNGFCEYF